MTIQEDLQLLEPNDFKFLCFVLNQIADTGGVWEGVPRRLARPWDKECEQNLFDAGLLEQVTEDGISKVVLTDLGWAVGFHAWYHHAINYGNMSGFDLPSSYDIMRMVLSVRRMRNDPKLDPNYTEATE